MRKFRLQIRNPFLADLDTVCDDDLAKDDLTELRTMQMLRKDFNSKNEADFWCSLTHAYPRLVKRAMIALLLQAAYASRDFRLFLLLKQRNRLNVKDDMRVTLLKTILQFHVLVEKKATTSFALK